METHENLHVFFIPCGAISAMWTISSVDSESGLALGTVFRVCFCEAANRLARKAVKECSVGGRLKGRIQVLCQAAG
ncbi:MAG: hypothetical protein ACYDDO_10155 [Acidiferrobacterales bacterium]